MIGRSTVTTPTRTGARTRAERSGPAMAMFFGTISPSTTCRDTTTTSARENAIGWTSASGMPQLSNSGSMRCASAGSPTAPRPSEQMVMPSWAPAIIRETFSMARRVVLAEREPCCARGSIWLRRAEMSANSAPTKKALKASSSTATRSAP